MALLLALQLVLANRPSAAARRSPSSRSAPPRWSTSCEATVAEANLELDRVDELIGSAESISATVDATSRLAYKALSAPMIKTVAIASGTSKAAKRLRKER